MRRVVLTCIDAERYEPLSSQWLPSLRASAKWIGPQDMIVIVDYGMTPEQIASLRDRGCVVRPAYRDPGGYVPVLRLRDTAEALRLFSDRDRAMMVDGSDVWFQDSLDPLFSAPGMIAAPEINPPTNGVNAAMTRWAKPAKRGPELLARVAAKPVINGGMVYGSVGLLRAYLAWAYLACTTGMLAGFGGTDQWALTLAAHDGIWPINTVGTERWNLALCAAESKVIVRNGSILTPDGVTASVIHRNAGPRTAPGWVWKGKTK